jgi:Putative transposase
VPPFGGPEVVLKYLARYTHRAAISNHRLLELEEGQVRFRWKDYAHGGRWRTMTLSAVEFVRRFLMHVLPSGFVRIRHYGLLANRHRREKLALCRELLGGAASEVEEAELTARPEGSDPVTPTRACPVCGAGRLVVIAELPAMDAARVGAGPAEREVIFDTS